MLAWGPGGLGPPMFSGSGRSCAGKDGETCNGCGTGDMHNVEPDGRPYDQVLIF